MKLILAFFYFIYYIEAQHDFIKPLYFILYPKIIENDNSISGTGNKLKDVVYKAICESLNCPHSCCEGPINQMKCADFTTCNYYRKIMNNFSTIKILIFALIPYLLFTIFFMTYKLLNNRHPGKYIKFNKFLKIYLGIIFPPFGLCLLIKYIRKKNIDDSIDSNKKSKKMYENMSVLFGNKQFELENFKDAIQLVDNGDFKISDNYSDKICTETPLDNKEDDF